MPSEPSVTGDERAAEIQRRLDAVAGTTEEHVAFFQNAAPDIGWLLSERARLRRIEDAIKAIEEPVYRSYPRDTERFCAWCEEGDWENATPFPHSPDCPWLLLQAALASPALPHEQEEPDANREA